MKKRKRFISMLLAMCLCMGAISGTALAADSSLQEEDTGSGSFGAFFEPWNQAPDSWRLPNWTQEDVSVTANGRTLSGTLTKPKDAKNAPIAILFHGLCTDRSYCEDLAWYLADRGIASVRFDFSGTGASSGRQEDMSVTTETQDALAILRYVESLSFVDTDNIFMLGKSMGGLTATLAADGREDEVKALVLWYPAYSLPDSIRHGFLLGQTFNPFDLPETVTVNGFYSSYTFGKTYLEEAAALDWESACKSYDGPVLMIHGDADIVVPEFYSDRAKSVFKDAELVVISGGNHGFWGQQENQALEATADFLLEQIAS